MPFGSATNGLENVSTEAMQNFVRMFKPQFADAVENGTKLQTVRPRPKRMPKPGDTISCRCWTEKPYRSKHRILKTTVVTQVSDIELTSMHRIKLAGLILNFEDAIAFAKADGFPSPGAMFEWFDNTHGLPFEGIVIIWK
jgi:hypothetical protein